MKVCLESYLLINIMMNALILDLSSRALGRRRPGRVLFAAALGGAWAVMIYVPGCGWMGSLAARLIMPAIMALIACGGGGARDFAAYLAAAMCMTMLMGGGALMISMMSGGWGWSQLGWCLVVCGALGLWLTHTRVKRTWGWELKIGMAFDGRECSLTALVDTGNHLREPISGACVLIASERAVKGVLPRGFSARGGDMPAGRWRMVRYQTLDGQGVLKCFRPDLICVRAGDMRTERGDVWVAVYPGALPGGAMALAPLEMSCAPGGNVGKGECGDAGYLLKN